MGAGGIGCYYGARLQVVGHEVVFVARGEHLQALRHKGLQVVHTEFHFAQAIVAEAQCKELSLRFCGFTSHVITPRCLLN